MTITHQITSNQNPAAGGGGLGDIASQLSGMLGQASSLIGGGVGFPGLQSIGTAISGLTSSITGAGGTANMAAGITSLGSQLSSLSSMMGAGDLLSSLTSQLSGLMGMLNLTGMSQVLHMHVLDKAKGIIASAFQGQHKTVWDMQGVTHTSSTAVTSTAPNLPHNGNVRNSDNVFTLLNTFTNGKDFASAFPLISDEKIKADIRHHEPVLDRIMRLNLKRFQTKRVDWDKGEVGEDNASSLGLIAQDVQRLFPEIVHEHNGLLAIEEGKVGLLVMHGFQEFVLEVRSRLDKMEARHG